MQTSDHNLLTDHYSGARFVEFREDHIPESRRPLEERLLVQIYDLPIHTEFDWIDGQTCVILDANQHYECDIWGNA